MTLALARKWRPRTFAEMVGQEHVVRALSNALSQNRLHHAYLLTGTRGVGKTTLARIVAKALNCETGVTAVPCGKCRACTEIDAGRFVDLIELDAASNTQVDNMRELLENALYAPSSARFKVYIIDEVHMLSRSAFNAMLKTLEEPPGHVKFILATTDPQKIPVTVLSRCLQFNLKQIPPAQIRGQLENVLGKEAVESEPAALNLIARAAEGSMRDALSLLDQAIAHGAGKVDEKTVREMLGVVDRGYLFSILRALAARNGPALMEEAERMAARTLSFDSALTELATLLHRVALAQTVPAAIGEDEPDRENILGLAGTFSAEEIQLLYQIAIHGRRDLGLAPDEFAGFTMALMRMLAFVPFEPDAAPDRARTPEPRGAPASPVAPASPIVRPSPDVPASPGPAATASKPSPAVTHAAEGNLEKELADWRALVGRLKLGGMARMPADHCEFRGAQGDNIELAVAEGHRHLVDKTYTEKLQAALGEHFGRKLRLRIAIGGSGNSPAEIDNQEKQTRLNQAIEAIDADPFVRDLVENFDARINDSSIKPIQ